MNSNHDCCCGGEAKKMPELDAILAKYEGYKGALIPVLQATQDAYGYLSREAMIYIAEKLDIPISQIYGVATFYTQFHMTPRGKFIIRSCQGTACHVRGAKVVLKALEDALGVVPGQTTPDLKFTLETVACIGACGLSPCIMVNDDTHGRLTPERVPEILARYA